MLAHEVSTGNLPNATSGLDQLLLQDMDGTLTGRSGIWHEGFGSGPAYGNKLRG